jgi:hypothetical protein
VSCAAGFVFVRKQLFLDADPPLILAAAQTGVATALMATLAPLLGWEPPCDAPGRNGCGLPRGDHLPRRESS